MAEPRAMGRHPAGKGGAAVLNREEVRRCLTTLKLAYPKAYAGMKKADGEEMISLWLTMFADDSFEEVSSAIASLIRNGAKYCPVIGEIKAEMGKADRKDCGALNRRPYPQSFIDTVHKFLAEEEAAD